MSSLPRGTADQIPSTRAERDPDLHREVRRLRQLVQALVATQVVTLLGVVALVAATERRSAGLKDAVWDAAEKAERAARETLPGAVSQARAQLEEVQGRLKAIDEQARSLNSSLAPGGEVALEARKLSEELRKSVRDSVRESVRREVSDALERQRREQAAEAAGR